jgi:hypothetical protein
MSQQVNLYQPILRAQPKVFSALTIVQFCGLLLLGLSVIYGYARWQDAKLGRDVISLQSQQDALLKRIEDFNTRYPMKQKNPDLERQLASLMADRSGKARAIEVLSGGVFGNTQGFSGYLEGLARQHVEGVWLTGVTISDGGEQLGLSGSTLDAQLVPRYLQQLSAEQAYKGREFNTFQMLRGEAPPHIDFTLHTAAAHTVQR